MPSFLVVGEAAAQLPDPAKKRVRDTRRESGQALD